MILLSKNKRKLTAFYKLTGVKSQNYSERSLSSDSLSRDKEVTPKPLKFRQEKPALGRFLFRSSP